VPLSTQALTILESLKSSTGGHELVFPSPFYPGKPLSDNTLNNALARLGYKGTATAHGFRTLFSTCANEAGWHSDVIEKQLAHEERDEVRGAYNRAQWLVERVELMQWWADYLQALRTESAASPGPHEMKAMTSGTHRSKFERQPGNALKSVKPVSTRRSAPAPIRQSNSQSTVPDPIEVLRALVAVFDQLSAAKP